MQLVELRDNGILVPLHELPFFAKIKAMALVSDVELAVLCCDGLIYFLCISPTLELMVLSSERLHLKTDSDNFLDILTASKK